jgi:hypothetical protein
METDLLVRKNPTAQDSRTPPQSSGESTPTRLKNSSIEKIYRKFHILWTKPEVFFMFLNRFGDMLKKII